jgi:RNA polymerase sigma factor (sigma-70 family)
LFESAVVLVRTHLRTMSDLETLPDEFLPTRRSLLTRLKNWDDQEGWREFFETYWKLLYTIALKAGLNDAEAQDLVQDTIVSVAKKMRHFHYDPALGSFKTWLLLNVRSRITDHFRRRQCRIPSASGTGAEPGQVLAVEQIPDAGVNDLEAVWEAEWKKAILETALARVRQRVSPHQFQIFDLCALRGLPLRKVAAALGVNLGQVYLARHRVARLVRQEVQRLETKML